MKLIEVILLMLLILLMFPEIVKTSEQIGIYQEKIFKNKVEIIKYQEKFIFDTL